MIRIVQERVEAGTGNPEIEYQEHGNSVAPQLIAFDLEELLSRVGVAFTAGINRMGGGL